MKPNLQDRNETSSWVGVNGPAGARASRPVSHTGAMPHRRFKLLNDRELDAAMQPGWLVKGILPDTGLAVCYGASGAGKSFLLLDLACSIAEGGEWFGRRTRRTPVVYLCLEGKAGFAGRVKAWKVARKRAMPELVRVVAQSFRLHDTDDVEVLIDAVSDFVRGLPTDLPAPLVVVDTLNRATAGSDENSSAAMGDTIAACTRISDMTGGLVLLVHHSGKDAERGMRGHTSLASAADAVLLVARSGDKRSWTAEKVKEGQDGLGATFQLEAIGLGVDEDGDEVASCVVRPGDALAPAGPRLPAALRAALRALQEVLPLGTADESGAVADDAWRGALVRSCTAASESGKRNAVSRAKAAMLAAGVVSETEGKLHVSVEGRELLRKVSGQ